MPLPDDPEGFAHLLASLVPADARTVKAGPRSGYAWQGRGGTGSAGLLDLPVFACVDAGGRASTGLHYGTRECDAYDGFVPWPLLRDLGLSGRRAPIPSRGPPPEGTLAFASRFVAGLDYGALRLVAEADAGDPEAYAWLSPSGHESARRRAFAAAFPWALDAMVESGRDLWDDSDADAACDLVRSSHPAGAGPARTLRRLVESTRGLGLHDLDRRSALRGLRAASFLPADWIPTGGPDAESLIVIAPHLLAHATRSGRPLTEAGRPSEGWASVTARLVALAGLAEHPAPLRSKVAGLSVLVEDRLDAFVQQVLRPALDAVHATASNEDLLRSAHRLVVGRRSYAGAVEDALRWQGMRTPSAEAVALLAERAGLAWDRPFPPLADRLGVEAACLGTPSELVAEGRAMSHCVARYLPACLAGERTIVSIRRPGRNGAPPERISTLELARGADGRLVPVQHRGYANTPPPDVAILAARRLALSLAASPVPAPGMGPEAASARLASLFRDDPAAGRSLWADVLGPELTEASPDRLVTAAGIDAAPHSPGPA